MVRGQRDIVRFRWGLAQVELWITTFDPPTYVVFSVWGWMYLVSQVGG